MSQPDPGVLVGRDAELAGLESLVSRTTTGSGGVVLLTGEPGIGKTRLARAAVSLRPGLPLLWGACRENAEAPPLWPWIQVLGRIGGPEVTASAGDGAAARFRLYELVADTLRESASKHPRLIVIDDLHRADEASLRLLGYLAETLWPAPVGLIVTYRDTEVAPESMTANVSALLARLPGSRRWQLPGLSEESVARWLASAGLGGVDAAELHERTGGNPLFISESIQLLADGADPETPLRSVGEVIRERAAPLPIGCREALEIASVLGRDFEYPPLASVLATSPEKAVAVLDPAVSARLIEPVAGRAGAYRFTHTLIRDAVAGQLMPSRRAELHARVFSALRDTGWGEASDLAHHAVRGRPGVSGREPPWAAAC